MLCIARHTNYDEESYATHKILHWQSFIRLQSEIMKYKCDICKDKQRGIDWIPIQSSINAGYSVRYQLQCTNCQQPLTIFDTGPRIVIEEKHDKLSITPTKTPSKLEAHSVNLLGVLLNIIALQHGSQDTLFKTMSAVLNLPNWSTNVIKTAKLAAAKIIKSVADTIHIEHSDINDWPDSLSTLTFDGQFLKQRYSLLR